MTTLSPAAQTVLDAYWTLADLLDREVSHDEMLAAALRAAADQVVPLHIGSSTSTRGQTRLGIRHKLLAIAAELEVHQ